MSIANAPLSNMATVIHYRHYGGRWWYALIGSGSSNSANPATVVWYIAY